MISHGWHHHVTRGFNTVWLIAHARTSAYITASWYDFLVILVVSLALVCCSSLFCSRVCLHILCYVGLYFYVLPMWPNDNINNKLVSISRYEKAIFRNSTFRRYCLSVCYSVWLFGRSHLIFGMKSITKTTDYWQQIADVQISYIAISYSWPLWWLCRSRTWVHRCRAAVLRDRPAVSLSSVASRSSLRAMPSTDHNIYSSFRIIEQHDRKTEQITTVEKKNCTN